MFLTRLAVIIVWLVAMLQGAAFAQSWTAVPYDQANFGVVSGGLNWVIEVGDHATFKYLVSGNTMTVAVAVEGTSMTGTANSVYLKIKIPGGYRCAGSGSSDYVFTSAYIRDNGTKTTGFAFVGGGNDWIGVSTPFSGPWQLSANNSAVYFTFTFEIVP